MRREIKIHFHPEVLLNLFVCSELACLWAEKTLQRRFNRRGGAEKRFHECLSAIDKPVFTSTEIL